MEKSSEILIFRPSSNAFGQNMVIFFNSNDNDDDSYYRSLNVFVVYLLQYPKHICAFVILFVHLLMMMMMLEKFRKLIFLSSVKNDDKSG